MNQVNRCEVGFVNPQSWFWGSPKLVLGVPKVGLAFPKVGLASHLNLAYTAAQSFSTLEVKYGFPSNNGFQGCSIN